MADTLPSPPPPRAVRFAAAYAAMLEPFISREETRYYLNGIFVQPHPDGGVMLTATDGHKLAAVHDKAGATNGNYICWVPAAMRQAARMAAISAEANKPPRNSKAGPVAQAWFADKAGYITNAEYTGDDPAVIGPCHLWAGYAHEIDGSYPEWHRVLPAAENVGLRRAIAGSNVVDGKPTPVMRNLPAIFNADYLAEYSKLARYTRHLPNAGANSRTVSIFPHDEFGPAVVLLAAAPEFYSLLMPVRESEPMPRPEWLAQFLKPKTQGAPA